MPDLSAPDADLIAEETSIGLAHLHAGRIAAAEAVLKSVLERQPSWVPAINGLGIIALKQNRVDQALRLFGLAVGADPTDASSLTNLSRVHLLRDALQDAEVCLERALHLAPNDPDALRERARLLLRQGQPALASDILDQLVARHPGNAQMRIDRASHLLLAGQQDAALADLETALGLDPASHEAWHNIAILRGQLGQHDIAARSFARALALDPGNPGTLLMAAEERLMAGDAAAAVRHARSLLAIAPGHGIGHRRLGLALVMDGQGDEGMSMLARAVQMEPADPHAMLDLAAAMMLQGHADKAARCIGQALRLDAANMPMVSGRAADLLFRLGRCEQAWTLLKPPASAPLASGAVTIHLPAAEEDVFALLPALFVASSRGVQVRVVPSDAVRGVLSQVDGISLEDQAAAGTAGTINLHMLAAQLGLTPALRGQFLLRPDPDRVMAWRAALSAHPRPWIGFAWQAGQQGIGLETLRQDVLSEPGTLISLMPGEERAALEAHPDILDGGLHLSDWQDACAAAAVCDLLVLPAGPLAQLAGLLGLRGIILSGLRDHWVWGAARHGVAWHPSLTVICEAPRAQMVAAAREAVLRELANAEQAGP